MSDPHRAHAHPNVARVLVAAAVTVAAGAIELVVSRLSGSLFLLADAIHLVAHLAIFVVLLLPVSGRHVVREDLAACAVLSIVVVIGAVLATTSIRGLVHAHAPPPAQAMLVSLLGLGANLIAAWLFRDPARERWSFRAALTHELADGSLTIAGLVGAAAIAMFRLRWVDPTLSLVIAIWLLVWASSLLLKRVRLGPSAWILLEERLRH